MHNTDITAFAASDNRTDVAPDDAGAVDRVAFDSAETRADEMRATIETWLADLGELVDDARASEKFRAWLDVQSRFHDYSYRNTLLIACQRPGATRVAGYRTWQDEFDRQVRAGEEAIWIWAPIIAKRCPECEQSRRYHERSECAYDGTPPDEWSKGVVAFKPVPVFDVSQTDGDALPELETAATGDGAALFDRLLEAAEAMDVDVHVVPGDEWAHGAAEGVCRWPNGSRAKPRIEVRDRPDAAAVAGTLVHELAHARLHADESVERPKREVEAEAVAYVVGRYFGLDSSNSAFYLAAWRGEEAAMLGERLGRIRRCAAAMIDVVGEG